MARQECVYPRTATKKISVSEDYLLELEARVSASSKEQEASLPPPESLDGESVAMPQAHNSPQPSSVISEVGDPDENPLTEGIARLVENSEGPRQYLGESSSLNLGLRFRDFIRTFRQDLGDGIDIDPPKHRLPGLAETPRRLEQEIESTITLPPFAHAKRLFFSQHAYFGTTFSFGDLNKFENKLKKVYDSPVDFHDRESCLDYCHVLITLAFGQLYSINLWTNNDGPPGCEYFQEALRFLPNMHDQGSTTFVEVLSLLAWFFQNLNRRDAAFLYIGIALRMAMSLGLHQEVSPQNYDGREREYRRRLWWSVFSMDRILCIKSGNPPMVADEDIGVSLPSRLPDESPSCSAIILRHYTELSAILGKVVKHLYRRERAPKYSLVGSVQSILADLAQWDANLPRDLHIDFAKLDQPLSREVVSIYLHYSHCINITARPLVFHIARSRLQDPERVNRIDWKAGVSRSTAAIIDTCIAAARNTVKVMTHAAKQNLIATYGYQDTEHAFSAALILVMVNIALPYNTTDRTAMTLGLDVLNGMAEKGSDHVKYLHGLLISLCPMITGFNQSDETLVTDTNNGAPVSNFNDTAAKIPQLDLPSNAGAFATMDDFLWGENVSIDASFWEEGYGTYDINMV